jgi:hypothetical protein
MQNAKPRTVVSILSPPLSGSTLLTYLLATHPQVATIGERKKFYRKVFRPDMVGAKYCSCGALFTDCPVWNGIKTKLISDSRFDHIASLDFTNFQLYHNFHLNRVAHKICLLFALRGPTWAQHIPYPIGRRFARLCDANARLIDAVLDMNSASVFVDSSKSARHTVYLHSVYTSKYDMRVILLLRDGRGQVYSTLKRGWAEDIEEACQKWVNQIKYLRKIVNAIRATTYLLEYEQLCSKPTRTMSEVFKFLNLDPEKGSLRFRDHNQHIMGNWEMRMGTSDQIQDGQEWRENLTSEQLNIFNKLAGETNRSLGYK